MQKSVKKCIIYINFVPSKNNLFHIDKIELFNLN